MFCIVIYLIVLINIILVTEMSTVMKMTENSGIVFVQKQYLNSCLDMEINMVTKRKSVFCFIANSGKMWWFHTTLPPSSSSTPTPAWKTAPQVGLSAVMVCGDAKLKPPSQCDVYDVI